MTKKWSEIRRSKMPADGPVMPPCPRCGGSVLAEALELTTKREDDGKRNVCRHVLFCATDGASWRWADRSTDPWSHDPVATTFYAKRLADAN